MYCTLIELIDDFLKLNSLESLLSQLTYRVDYLRLRPKNFINTAIY